MAVVHLIRHGQASFGADEYDELSELGRLQSRTLGAVLAARRLRFDRAVSGSLRRQRDTAKLCLEAAGISPSGGVEIDDRWNEYDHLGLVEHHLRRDGGMPPEAAVSSRAFQVLLDGALERWIRGDQTAPGAPTWAGFSERVWAGLEDLLASLGRGGSAAVFTSGGAITAVCGRLLGLPPAGCVALHRVVINGGITKIVSGRSGTALISFNDHAHFDGDASGQLTYR
jgi:broad specificity phosphatase PhoE